MKKLTISIKKGLLTSKEVNSITFYSSLFDSMSNNDVEKLLTPYLKSKKYILTSEEVSELSADDSKITNINILLNKIRRSTLSYWNTKERRVGYITLREEYPLNIDSIEVTETSNSLYNEYPKRYYSVEGKGEMSLFEVNTSNVAYKIGERLREIGLASSIGAMVRVFDKRLCLSYNLTLANFWPEHSAESGIRLENSPKGLIVSYTYDKGIYEDEKYQVFVI